MKKFLVKTLKIKVFFVFITIIGIVVCVSTGLLFAAALQVTPIQICVSSMIGYSCNYNDSVPSFAYIYAKNPETGSAVAQVEVSLLFDDPDTGYEKIPDPSWIQLVEPTNFTLLKGEQRAINMIINIPNDTQYYLKKYHFRIEAIDVGPNAGAGGIVMVYLDIAPFSVSYGTASSPIIEKIGMIGNRIVFNSDFSTMGDGINKVTLLYRKKGEDSYVSTFFNPEPAGAFYTGRTIIPKEEVTFQGLEYYIEIDTTGEENLYSPLGAPSVPYYLEVSTITTGVVTSEGGTVTVVDGNPEDGETSVNIPRNALTADAAITITQRVADEINVPLGSRRFILSDKPVAVYDFSPDNLAFRRSVTLTMLYLDNESDDLVDQSDGFVDDTFPPVDAATLKLFYWDGHDWRYIGGTVDTVNHTVTATISHFSMYALFAARGPESKDFRPFERIITPNGDGKNDYADFNGLDSSVKIFDIRGKKIRTLNPETISVEPYIEIRWDGRDDSSDIVESGVYIYQYKYNGKLTSGVIAVAK
ncbi:gliding motility-associated C-terminal domain-containing protein [bacterium]|nr:gliding motility-associated C-terminal domain-containing protein [bacterium]